jgi:putative addiction module component (TIGR02574 family)
MLEAMAIRQALRDELLNLSSEERQKLADELYESLVEGPRDPEWEEAWSKEIAQRVQEIVDGKADLIDADEVHAELRAELRGANR